MRQNLYKFNSTFWLIAKLILYILMMIIFVVVMGRGSIGLTRISRTLGITITTFLVLELLFVKIYGQYDIGRRKSKPIIYSLVLAILCTDLITYLELMIMRTNVQDVLMFRLSDIGLLTLAFIIQTIVIILFAYGGNAIFFTFHEPEKCCIITSSQDSLDRIVFAVEKYKKQYCIVNILNCNDKNIIHDLTKMSSNIDSIFIYDVPSSMRARIMRLCYHYRINVYFNPDVEDIMESSAEQYILEDIYLFNKNVMSLTMEQRILKRLTDIFMSIILGILTSPLWIGAMIAIKLDDGGPVFFKQERATINGKRFEVYKLRTMRPNDDDHSALADDDRITKPGKFLRKTRIDELPQLINVLKGEMSFVGPRPEMIKNVTEYEEELPEFHYRLRVKAGITGYAQIHGKYNTSPKDKLAMDMMYIENFSILHDFQLIFQTLIVLLKSDSTEGFSDEETHCGYTFPESTNSYNSAE